MSKSTATIRHHNSRYFIWAWTAALVWAGCARGPSRAPDHVSNELSTSPAHACKKCDIRKAMLEGQNPLFFAPAAHTFDQYGNPVIASDDPERCLPAEVLFVPTKIELVYVEPGRFEMGSKRWEGSRPIHPVLIDSGFYMAKYELTHGSWDAIWPGHMIEYNIPMKVGPRFPKCAPYQDIERYISGLNAILLRNAVTCVKFDFPSEAEWEYSCRAGTRGDFFFDNGVLDDYCWHEGNSCGREQPVGLKRPNSWGLYDMYGNLSELCKDDWRESYDGSRGDAIPWKGSGPDDGFYYKVRRGGSSFSVGCDSVSRSGITMDSHWPYVGARLVLRFALE